MQDPITDKARSPLLPVLGNAALPPSQNIERGDHTKGQTSKEETIQKVENLL
jgi:hypothetical protein